MFKQDVTQVVQMRELQTFFRLHFGTERFTIYNKDSLGDVEFEIPANFNSSYQQRKKNVSIVSRVKKIFDEDMVDLRNVQVVVYYLAMQGVMQVSGKVRVEALRRGESF